MSFSRAFELVRTVNTLDLPHRRGWKPSDKPHAFDVQHDLEAETLELHEALAMLVLAEGEFADGDGSVQAREVAFLKAVEELGDVFAVTLQIAYRLKLKFEDLDKEASRKIRARFIGVPAVLPP